MKFVAIRQEKSGKNKQFISDTFESFTLDDVINKVEAIPLSNVKVIRPRNKAPYIRANSNKNKSDNLDAVAITCNVGDYLLFDREKLYLKALNGRVKKSWEAFSGNVEAAVDDQDKKEFGPLPEGEYVVQVDETLDYEDSNGLWDTIKWKLKSSRWGYIATPLEQVEGESFDRGSFYIHGGKEVGTAGCIELNGDLNKNFHSYMALYDRPFKLIVRYKK